MAAKGIKTPTELARRLKLNRQTVHKWVNGDVDALEVDLLFRLAEVLDMNPRWLATREGGPQAPRPLSMEDQRVLDLYRSLKPGVRNSWVQSGDALLSASGEPSVAQPFKHR